MISTLLLFYLASAFGILLSTAQPTSVLSASNGVLASCNSPKQAECPESRPFYMIAHRILRKKSLEDALKHGANALEIDMTAWDEGWWADHDGDLDVRGDPARDLFENIVEEQQAGNAITFVWLDIKNPDQYDSEDPNTRHSSVAGLRDLARELLQPAGIRVLYGYILSANSKTYPSIRDGLNGNEAINLDGDPKSSLHDFEDGGPANVAQRVSSYGSSELSQDFGNCTEESYYTCTELRQAVESRKFGKVFGWTLAAGQAEYVEYELGNAGVDGIIYGFKRDDFYDEPDTRAAASDILQWVNEHPDRYFIATNNDPPW